MKMYVIVDKYNEDFYWNFEMEDFDHMLTEKCLLPTKEIANNLIEEELGSDFIAAGIIIYQISKSGDWEYSVEDVWTDEYKDDEEEEEAGPSGSTMGLIHKTKEEIA